MCVVSMIYDHHWDKWKDLFPPPPQPVPSVYPSVVPQVPVPFVPAITPAEIAEFRKLLERAREYDKRNNEPDCELKEKRKRLKDLAKELGVEIDFI